MSRTYRRKNETWEYKWVTRDWKKFHGSYYFEECELEGKERKEAINKFHSDNASVMASAPSWFVNMFITRKDRSQERQELKRILQCIDDDYEEYSFQPYRHNAQWMWW